MENAIKNKIPIEVDLEPNRDEIYSGICIKSNENVFILVCFNADSKEFDGYAILRNNEIEKFRYWEEEEIKEIKRNNFSNFEKKFPISNMNTFYDCLNELKNEKLIAIYTKEDDNSYFEGRIELLKKDEVELKLLNESAEWIHNKVIRIENITYIGFDSSYENELLKKLYNIL